MDIWGSEGPKDIGPKDIGRICLMYTFVTFGVLRRKNCESPQDASKGSNEAYTVTTRQRFMCRLATRPVLIGGGQAWVSSIVKCALTRQFGLPNYRKAAGAPQKGVGRWAFYKRPRAVPITALFGTGR